MELSCISVFLNSFADTLLRYMIEGPVTAKNHDQFRDGSSWLEKLRARWGLTSLGQVVVILVVFSITGMSVLFLRNSFFSFLGFNDLTSMWIKSVSYVLFIIPAYQILILFFGFLFGQFAFFWEKEKRLIAAIKRVIIRKNES